MSLPGFNAETSLYRTKPGNRETATHSIPAGVRAVVPQRENGGPQCGACSNLILGTQWCCEGDFQPICEEQLCGIAVDIARTLGRFFT